jgi:hypothetical protein
MDWQELCVYAVEARNCTSISQKMEAVDRIADTMEDLQNPAERYFLKEMADVLIDQLYDLLHKQSERIDDLVHGGCP